MERIPAFVSWVKERKSKQTARAYKRGAERFEKFCRQNGVNGTLEETPRGFLDTYVSWMLHTEKLSAATVRLMLSGTRTYIDWRERQGETVPQYFTPDLPKIVSKEPFSLGPQELVQYWRICAMHPDPARTMMILLPLCGLRSEEMATIRLPEGVEIRGSWVIFHVVGKGSKPRAVPLLPQGNTILKQYLTGWRALRGGAPNPYLFPGHAKGQPYHTRSLRRHLKDVRKELTLREPLTPHVLRKTYLTFLDKSGMSPFAIAKIAGHSNVRTTHEHYIAHNVEGLIDNLGGVKMPAPPDEEDQHDADEEEE